MFGENMEYYEKMLIISYLETQDELTKTEREVLDDLLASTEERRKEENLLPF